MRVMATVEMELDLRSLKPEQVEAYVRERLEKAIKDGVIVGGIAAEVIGYALMLKLSSVSAKEVVRVHEGITKAVHPDDLAFMLDAVVEDTAADVIEEEAAKVNMCSFEAQLDYIAARSPTLQDFYRRLGIDEQQLKDVEEACIEEKPEVQLQEGEC